jgi:hypothetical protein
LGRDVLGLCTLVFNALASVIVAPCIGVFLVIGALTGGLGHIHRALIEKPASKRLSALIRHRS